MSEYIIDMGNSSYKSSSGLLCADVSQLRGEIVRCRDCRYFNCLWVDCYVCKRNGEKFMPFVELDDYCAWGIKK